MKIICWWSGGITSAVACKLAIDKFGINNCQVIFLDTGNEHQDTYRFLKDCEKWFNLPIEILKSDDYKNIQETWYKHLSLNTASGAICSYMLKRRVREKWEKNNQYDHQVFGFEYDKKELNRAKSLLANHPQTNPIFPLIDEKLTKENCIKIVKEANIAIPIAYTLGFKNNNCLNTGCVQGGIGYWKKMQIDFPDKFETMAKVEHELTDLKGQPVTMLKDQSNEAKIVSKEDASKAFVFLKPHPKYKNKCIDDMKGRPITPLQECNGLCGINDLNERNATEDEINWLDYL